MLMDLVALAQWQIYPSYTNSHPHQIILQSVITNCWGIKLKFVMQNSSLRKLIQHIFKTLARQVTSIFSISCVHFKVAKCKVREVGLAMRTEARQGCALFWHGPWTHNLRPITNGSFTSAAGWQRLCSFLILAPACCLRSVVLFFCKDQGRSHFWLSGCPEWCQKRCHKGRKDHKGLLFCAGCCLDEICYFNCAHTAQKHTPGPIKSKMPPCPLQAAIKVLLLTCQVPHEKVQMDGWGE